MKAVKKNAPRHTSEQQSESQAGSAGRGSQSAGDQPQAPVHRQGLPVERGSSSRKVAGKNKQDSGNGSFAGRRDVGGRERGAPADRSGVERQHSSGKGTARGGGRQVAPASGHLGAGTQGDDDSRSVREPTR